MGGSSEHKPKRNQIQPAGNPLPTLISVEDLEALRERCAFLESQLANLDQIYSTIEDSLQYEKDARLRLEQTLATVKHQLKESRAVQSEFIDNMSHELRTPLNGILGMTQLMLGMPLNPELREYAETIDRSGQILDKIISSLLAYSELSKQDVHPERAPFILEDILEETIVPLANEALTHDINFYCLLNCKDKHVIGDASRIQQILSILVENALKFTQGGYIMIEASMEASEPYASDTQRLLLNVSDTGPGIDPSMFDAIFEPFRQVDGSRTRAFGGIGMGLALCKRLVKLLGGTIGVESSPGEGATFTVTIPLELDGSPQHPASSPQQTLQLGIVTQDATLYKVINHYARDAGFADATWFKPGDIHSTPQVDVDLMIVDHPLSPSAESTNLDSRFFASRPQTRFIAVASHAKPISGPERSRYDVFITRPILRRPLADALDFAGLMIEPQDAKKPAPAPSQTSSRPRVLILEPVRTNQKILSRMVDTLNFAIDIVEHIEDVPEKLESFSYRAILLNPMVDKTPDFASIRHIFSTIDTDRELEIIAITGKTASYNLAALREAGVSRLLVVPVKLDQLREALHRE